MWLAMRAMLTLFYSIGVLAEDKVLVALLERAHHIFRREEDDPVAILISGNGAS